MKIIPYVKVKGEQTSSENDITNRDHVKMQVSNSKQKCRGVLLIAYPARTKALGKTVMKCYQL